MVIYHGTIRKKSPNKQIQVYNILFMKEIMHQLIWRGFIENR